MPSVLELENNKFEVAGSFYKSNEPILRKAFVEEGTHDHREGTISVDTPAREREHLAIYLRLDQKSRRYHREFAKFLDFLGDIGGMLEIVTTIGFFVTAPFVLR